MSDDVIRDGKCDEGQQVHPPPLVAPKGHITTTSRDQISVRRKEDRESEHARQQHGKSRAPNAQRNGGERKYRQKHGTDAPENQASSQPTRVDLTERAAQQTQECCKPRSAPSDHGGFHVVLAAERSHFQCQSPPSARIVEGGDPNALRVEVEFDADGYLVVADMNDHGWEAFLDGERVPVLQADYAFRAARIPAGSHSVEFRYVPLDFWAGAGVSGLAAIVLAAILLSRLRRNRADHPPAEMPARENTA